MNAEIPIHEPAAQETAAPRKRSRLWLFIVLFLVLAGGGAGGWYYFMGAKGEEAAAEAAPMLEGPPIYVALDPPFVVNFETDQLVRFLQVTVQLMSRDPVTVDLLKTHDPVVRNDLLMLLANQRYDVLATREGKEKLRASALETVRKVVQNAGGKPEYVEAVYFTSFVMQ